MKKFFLLCGVLIFWGSCKTSPTFVAVPFEPFEIRKIVEKGIQPVVIQAGKGVWPAVTYKELSPLRLDAKKIKIAVLGDTGCRLKESHGKGSYQNCNLTQEWPFPEIVQSLVKESYDFAIHLGDYHYREQCSDKKLCSGYTNSIGYGWNAWWDDFYGPSQALFKKSPVLLVRGNHEDCNRAYAGWGPISAGNKKFEDVCTETEPYQWIEIGDLVFINFDNAAFEDRKPTPEKQKEKWIQALREISNRITQLKSKKEIWFIAHKPVLGFVPVGAQQEPSAIGEYLKVLLEETGLVKKIDYILAGHIHNQQLVFSQKDLLQIIVGHSGAALDPFGHKITNKKMISTTDSSSRFGYGLFERKSFKNWKFIFKDVKGKTDLSCTVRNKKINCR